jgi:hypothetical protein
VVVTGDKDPIVPLMATAIRSEPVRTFGNRENALEKWLLLTNGQKVAIWNMCSGRGWQVKGGKRRWWS